MTSDTWCAEFRNLWFVPRREWRTLKCGTEDALRRRYGPEMAMFPREYRLRKVEAATGMPISTARV